MPSVSLRSVEQRHLRHPHAPQPQLYRGQRQRRPEGHRFFLVHFYDLGDDSVHVGLNGAAVTSSDRMTIATLGSWVWSKKTMDSSSATIIIPSIGVYTLNVWMREDLFRLDRILLTTGTTTPSGSGPAESPRS